MQRFFRGAAVCLIAAVSCIALTNAVQAAKFNKKVDVGQQAPDFEGLAGIDGKSHSLGDYKDSKVVILIFTGSECPSAQSCVDRFKQIQREYAEQGVQVIAICSTVDEAQSLDKMKQYATDREFNFPYLSDVTQEAAKAYGATCTPHAFVLDHERHIAYMGAFDDNALFADKVKRSYVRDAVDALLAGKTPEIREMLQKGCAIEYK